MSASRLISCLPVFSKIPTSLLHNCYGNSTVQVRSNAWRASIGKIARSKYLLRYPIRIVKSDGSTVELRSSEPRQVVQLAVDLKALSEDERRQRLAARKPKAKKIEEEVIDDNFDEADYLQYFSQSASKKKSI
ncbi:unnamed protein product [Auanema sp. JU1783]|nr:unnamed protein product [Auanema sp. JU1783]